MTGQRGANEISIAGNAVDPLTVQESQRDVNTKLPPSRLTAWIVQFVEPLDAATTSSLRAEFGLRLTEYVPPRGYIESLTVTEAERLGVHPAVRAVMRMDSQFKLDRQLRSELENNEPSEPGPLDIVVFDQFADAVLGEIRAMLPASDILAVLDDRHHGGALVVRVTGSARTAAVVSTLDGVRWLQQVPQAVDDREAAVDGAATPADVPRGALGAELGLSGSGQVVGVIDSGPPDLQHVFFKDPAVPDPGPTHRKVLQIRNAAGKPPGKHPTFTCGIAAGDDSGDPGGNNDRGVAWAAKLVCGNRADLDTTSLLTQLVSAAEMGACVHSNSWHTVPQGFSATGVGLPATYDQRAVDVDTFTWLNEDHVVVGSSGNTGEEQGPPGTAKNALCVSAAASGGGDTVGDGCPGPTADGRRKPDLVGVGCGVRSALVGTPDGIGASAACASSYAAPWVTGILALIRQQAMERKWGATQLQTPDGFVPSGALLRALVLNSAVAAGPDPAIPSAVRGWGPLDPDAALGQSGPRILVDVRNRDGLTRGESCRLSFELAGTSRLAVTLVWTDPPGAVGSDMSVVNNLDLRVTGPNGEALRGNCFSSGESIRDGVTAGVDPTAMVALQAAEPGRWIVEVAAVEVNRGNPGQGFALVVSGEVATAAAIEGDRPILVTVPAVRVG